MSQDESREVDAALANALALFGSGRFDAGVDAVKSIAQLHAHSLLAQLKCARAFGRSFAIGEAEATLEHAAALAPPDRRYAVAMAYQEIGRPERAVSVLEEIRDAGQLPGPSLAILATLYAQSNRLTEAAEALEECVAAAPSQPQPKVLLARVRRQAGDATEAERLLLAVLANPAPDSVQVHGWSELSLIRDAEGDYAQAVECIERAKTLLRALPEAQRQTQRSRAISDSFARLYSEIDAATIQQFIDQPCESLPTAVAHLTGFRRSGTTLLEQVLDRHPAIHAAPERPVFSRAIFPAMCGGPSGKLSLDALLKLPASALDGLRRSYLKFHAALAGYNLDGRVLLDKNPNHTSLLAGIVRLLPESRILFALRDPRDVIVSTYMRFFTLTEFSASYLTWESNVDLYTKDMDVWLCLRELVPDNWLEVKYEDAVDDLAGTARRAVQFLGLEWSDELLSYRDDSQKFIHSPTHAEVRKPVYRSAVGRWKHYERCLEPHLARLAPYVERLGYS